MSVTDDALAAAFRTGLPFVGLRDHAHDPDLDRLIPPDAARTARAIPLTADDDRIRLAVADPDTDLSTLDRYLAGRQIDLALAPREEIDTILGPPPPPIEEPPEEPEPATVEADEPATVEADEREAFTEADAGHGRLAAAADPLAAEDDAPPIEPDPLISEPEQQPLADEGPAATYVARPDAEPSAEPDPFAAEAETDRLAEPDQVAGEEAATSEPASSEPEQVAAEAAPEAGAAPTAPEPVAAAAPAERAELSDADAGLAGEVPSWLEPRRRRWWRVVLAVLLVLVVLAVAAVAVVALVNA